MAAPVNMMLELEASDRELIRGFVRAVEAIRRMQAEAVAARQAAPNRHDRRKAASRERRR